MQQYIGEFSKYIIVLFVSFYTYECFAVFRFRTEEERKGIYIRQNIFMFLVHFTCFAAIYARTGKLELLFFFLFQQIALYSTIVLYHMIYPKANRLVVNNMCFLLSVGFVILTRLSYDKAVRQFIIAVVSLGIALTVPELITRVKRWKDFVWIYGVIGIVALGIVLVSGAVTNGSRLTWSVFGIAFQPSEFVKIVFVFFVAALLDRSCSFWNIALSALFAGMHVLILVASRDLGSALIFFVTYIIMVYAASGKKRYLAAGIFGGGFASYFAWRFFTHVQVRVQAWRDPWSVIDGAGYQITQSLFAIGCGGMFGLGLYQGSPKSIPYVETDFIFSAIIEELGLLFGLCLLLIYLSCFVMFMETALSMKPGFYRLTAVGLGITYIFQVFLTIGGGIKFIPLTGVTLPLISYGGSSVLSTLLLFSVIQGLYLLGGKKNGGMRKKKIADRREKAEEYEEEES